MNQHPSILLERPQSVFVILAVTLDQWQSPHSEVGRAVLMEHYQWAASLKEQNKLLLAGPVDLEWLSANQMNPVGHTTGIIFLVTNNREEAVLLAEQDPFHRHGYRKNEVHAMKISMADQALWDELYKNIFQHE